MERELKTYPNLLLENLELIQFKNYQYSKFTFHPIMNAIIGMNGKGKTNLLDAIYTLSFTKSYFSKNDNLNIRFGDNGFRLNAGYKKFSATTEIEIILRENNKKELFCNKELIKKYSSFIGTIPNIIITPDDIDLINGTADIRRSFIDKFIAQIDKDYLVHLISYQKIIQQKSFLLKDWQIKKSFPLLETYNQQLEEYVNILYEKRKFYLEKLIFYAIEYYNFLSDANDFITLKYVSQLENKTWKELLLAYSPKECLAQRTLIGVHKDDFLFNLETFLFKEIASQGQKKSLLLALKIAEAKIIYEEKKVYPLLLLDDIFEKLDDKRLEKLFELILQFQFMQIFITDVNQKRTENKLKRVQKDFLIINL